MGSPSATIAHEHISDSGTKSANGRCRHFETLAEQLPFELTVAFIPLRRCLLAERMVRLLIKSDSSVDAQPFLLEPDSNRLNCRCGPDRGSISRAQCTITRCHTSCHPAFEETLLRAGLMDEDEPGCEAPAAVEG